MLPEATDRRILNHVSMVTPLLHFLHLGQSKNNVSLIENYIFWFGTIAMGSKAAPKSKRSPWEPNQPVCQRYHHGNLGRPEVGDITIGTKAAPNTAKIAQHNFQWIFVYPYHIRGNCTQLTFSLIWTHWTWHTQPIHLIPNIPIQVTLDWKSITKNTAGIYFLHTAQCQSQRATCGWTYPFDLLFKDRS